MHPLCRRGPCHSATRILSVARAEEVASPRAVLETAALLLSYALVVWSGPRGSNSRDRFGRPLPQPLGQTRNVLAGCVRRALSLYPRQGSACAATASCSPRRLSAGCGAHRMRFPRYRGVLVVRARVERAQPEGGWVTATWGRQSRNAEPKIWHLRDESNVPSRIRSPGAGVPRRRCVVEPCPWNRTWSSRAYKARAVPSGPQGKCHSSIDRSRSTDEWRGCQIAHPRASPPPAAAAAT